MGSTFQAADWGGGPSGQPLLAPGTLRGYRLMAVVRQPRMRPPLRLRGGWTTWKHPEMAAECLPLGDGTYPFWPYLMPGQEPPDCNGTPGNDCNCGIYNSYTAAFDPTDRPAFHWIAVTANWGKLMLGPYGFRSANARILAVAPRHGGLRPWKQRYRLEDTASAKQQRAFMARFGVDVQPTLEDLLATYPPDDVSVLRPEPEVAA